MNQYPVENLLREPTEIYTSLTCMALALLAVTEPHLFLLTQGMGNYAGFSLMVLGFIRGYQAFRVKRYHRRLIAMPHYALSTTEVPVSKKWLFLGKGFRWLPHHTQRLHQIKQIRNESFMQRSGYYRKIRDYCKNHENSLLARLFNNPARFNPFKPDPPVGGSPYLHGLGEKDSPIYIPHEVRVGHTFVVGTTRVGKTRLASILINQDIRNGEAVIVVDPKGDLDLVRDMYSACHVSQRLHDFRIVHLGFPELSAHYNPLKNYDQVSEVATRITDAIQAEGEGKQFAAFAWKYINIVAICLEEMKQPITYKSIAFYVSRLDQLLMAYSDSTLPAYDSNYHEKIEEIIANNDCRVDKYGNTPPPMSRSKAVVKYLQEHISKTITSGNVESLHDQVLIDLFDAAIMDKNYYDKITASVGPVLSEINKSNASSIFSFHKSSCEIELMSAIKKKQVIYIGLDSLTNPNIAQAVGKAFLSDLVSTAGKIYKESNAHYRLNLHCDELSEIIQDSFVKILNKAGGAGFQVTAYAQTKQDMEVALGSKAKAEVTEGNLNTLIMLRVKNEETANLLVKVLPKVGVVDHTQVSMVNDTPHGEDGVYFNTTNEDRVQTTAVPMIDVNDIISLPKGQAFVLVNGGELYKVRIPLPVNDGLAPKDIKSAIRAINQLNDNLGD
ncbi:TPA: type IV conjugative transfer system coupling protein TraD [Legionella pneumophila]|nr:type IV conjugative transfer system coupling protein TraD [Legionella pneumophila]HAU1562704.1 type IV conjugative transfer system coupling protein TraD [Legionella pneumophila]HAU1860139.1 type IV conjugative transfer system coupling protein TraD [Legionella pneumophila]HCD9578464.1 type IV conjugative transfer system coupling protein TraD [Legionella pneumophila]HCD9579971.1 type IV conjugative transfer system coupling protein TraD [Legionella pneumophila]